MDFMKSYSSVLSSKENSKSDTVLQQVQPKIPKDQIPPKQPSPSKQSAKKTTEPLAQSELKQSLQQTAVSKTLDSVLNQKQSTFQQLLEDALYNFKKQIAYALEQGIQEQLTIEKSTLLKELSQKQEKIDILQKEVTTLRKENDSLQISVAAKESSQTKMATLIADLKEWRIESLTAVRGLKDWQLIARHGKKCKTYINLLQDQHLLNVSKKALANWRSSALAKKNAQITQNSKQEVQKMHEEREEFFSRERSRYETEIHKLRKELSGFAVKERKLKDVMKQAFLKGINAISLEATSALDKTDNISMPKKMQEDLEREFMQQGGDPDQINVVENEVYVQGIQDAEEYIDEEAELLESYQIQQNIQNVQPQVLPASPANPVYQHQVQQYVPERENMMTVQQQLLQQIQPTKQKQIIIPKPQPQQVKVPQKTNKYIQENNSGTLAARLRTATKTKLDPGSQVYKESIKAINLRIEKE